MKREDVSASTIEMIIDRRQKILRAKDALFWAIINCICATTLLIDFYNGFLGSYFESFVIGSFICVLEVVLSIVFVVSAIYDFSYHAWFRFWMKPLEVTSQQRKMFRIHKDESGFTDFVSRKNETSPNKTPLIFSISSNTPPSSNSQPWTKTGFYTSTPSNLSLNVDRAETSNLSWSFHKTLSNTSGSFDESFLRKRTNVTASSSSIKDEDSLKSYLKLYEEMEEKVNQMTEIEQHQNQTQSLSLQKPRVDVSITNYQPANDSLISACSDHEDNFSAVLMNSKSVESICLRLNITPAKLNQWLENIRVWISQNVLNKLVKDIDKINETLSKAGLVESLIGEAGLSSLKQLSTLKSKEITTLSNVLPYLEFSIHQEYLVKRFRDLSKGACISDFIWNGGTSYKGKQWSEEWPTDAQLIMHSFCTYMNSRLPSHPNYPEAKTFSAQYFRTVPMKSGEKCQIHIYQSQFIPPHFKVILKDDDVCEIPKGRNNVYYALIVFLHFIKVRHYGFLGRVNLGPSGVNILRTIE